MNRDHKYESHTVLDIAGFNITDATISSGDRIWVGPNTEGRWLSSLQVRELAASLIKVADAHDARLADNVTMPDYLDAMGRENP
ncbi:hypothetical protein RY831_26835 [Noviherbaspirillum sp. CPCC 100848]|uniref:Uncharacterized protein n=1 Tax=Noviherbaspirillum album TaxID=3080276 RepID=A0ABU6JH29_9BURK|nr:hypothetical protein [Noviherbaspirillum sp. CPCC 100848]MEC4722781.1 hypothetical protein [Noviherbaspirillum sp. CPCC 100848]